MKKITVLLVFVFICTALLSFSAAGETSLSIPEDAVEFEGHKYKFYQIVCDWQTASDHCKKLGGHLVTVSSQKENNFVSKLIKNNYIWLGASDADEEGVFLWETGETFKYTNWLSGQPDNYNEQDRIGMMPSGKWDDAYAAAQVCFVCEWGVLSAGEEAKLDSGSFAALNTFGDRFTDWYNGLDNFWKPIITVAGCLSWIIIPLAVLLIIECVKGVFAKKREKRRKQTSSFDMTEKRYSGSSPYSSETGDPSSSYGSTYRNADEEYEFGYGDDVDWGQFSEDDIQNILDDVRDSSSGKGYGDY